MNELTKKLFLKNVFDEGIKKAVYIDGKTYCVKTCFPDGESRHRFRIKDHGDNLLHRHILKGVLNTRYFAYKS